eukprot:jgi/Bigna1/82821/fgenesh1_pg.98_\
MAKSCTPRGIVSSVAFAVGIALLLLPDQLGRGISKHSEPESSNGKYYPAVSVGDVVGLSGLLPGGKKTLKIVGEHRQPRALNPSLEDTTTFGESAPLFHGALIFDLGRVYNVVGISIAFEAERHPCFLRVLKSSSMEGPWHLTAILNTYDAAEEEEAGEGREGREGGHDANSHEEKETMRRLSSPSPSSHLSRARAVKLPIRFLVSTASSSSSSSSSSQSYHQRDSKYPLKNWTAHFSHTIPPLSIDSMIVRAGPLLDLEICMLAIIVELSILSPKKTSQNFVPFAILNSSERSIFALQMRIVAYPKEKSLLADLRALLSRAELDDGDSDSGNLPPPYDRRIFTDLCSLAGFLNDFRNELRPRPLLKGGGRRRLTSVFTDSVEHEGLGPRNVLSQNVHTRWSSDWGEPHWLLFDLGGMCDIAAVALQWEVAFAYKYKIQISNNLVSWQTVKTEKLLRAGWRISHLGEKEGGDEEEEEGEGISGSGSSNRDNQKYTDNYHSRRPFAVSRFLRIYCERRATEYGFSIISAKIFGTRLLSDLTLNELGLDGERGGDSGRGSVSGSLLFPPEWLGERNDDVGDDDGVASRDGIRHGDEQMPQEGKAKEESSIAVAGHRTSLSPPPPGPPSLPSFVEGGRGSRREGDHAQHQQLLATDSSSSSPSRFIKLAPLACRTPSKASPCSTYARVRRRGRGASGVVEGASSSEISLVDENEFWYDLVVPRAVEEIIIPAAAAASSSPPSSSSSARAARQVEVAPLFVTMIFPQPSKQHRRRHLDAAVGDDADGDGGGHDGDDEEEDVEEDAYADIDGSDGDFDSCAKNSGERRKVLAFPEHPENGFYRLRLPANDDDENDNQMSSSPSFAIRFRTTATTSFGSTFQGPFPPPPSSFFLERHAVYVRLRSLHSSSSSRRRIRPWLGAQVHLSKGDQARPAGAAATAPEATKERTILRALRAFMCANEMLVGEGGEKERLPGSPWPPSPSSLYLRKLLDAFPVLLPLLKRADEVMGDEEARALLQLAAPFPSPQHQQRPRRETASEALSLLSTWLEKYRIEPAVGYLLCAPDAPSSRLNARTPIVRRLALPAGEITSVNVFSSSSPSLASLGGGGRKYRVSVAEERGEWFEVAAVRAPSFCSSSSSSSTCNNSNIEEGRKSRRGWMSIPIVAPPSTTNEEARNACSSAAAGAGGGGDDDDDGDATAVLSRGLTHAGGRSAITSSRAAPLSTINWIRIEAVDEEEEEEEEEERSKPRTAGEDGDSRRPSDDGKSRAAPPLIERVEVLGKPAAVQGVLFRGKSASIATSTSDYEGRGRRYYPARPIDLMEDAAVISASSMRSFDSPPLNLLRSRADGGSRGGVGERRRRRRTRARRRGMSAITAQGNGCRPPHGCRQDGDYYEDGDDDSDDDDDDDDDDGGGDDNDDLSRYSSRNSGYWEPSLDDEAPRLTVHCRSRRNHHHSATRRHASCRFICRSVAVRHDRGDTQKVHGASEFSPFRVKRLEVWAEVAEAEAAASDTEEGGGRKGGEEGSLSADVRPSIFLLPSTSQNA